MTPTCCNHLNARCIEKAVAAVQHARLSSSSHDSICLECGLSGFFNDAKFRLHFLIEQHYVYVRVKEPLELYCCHCGDFQYSDDFDLLIGRKRSRRTLTTLESRRSKKTLIDRPRPRAIVNLGATCFMGSVLQVMLNNSVIFFSKQMQQSRSGLDLCSKGKHEMQKNNAENNSSNSNSIIGVSSTVTVKEGSTTESAIVIGSSSTATSMSTSTSSSLISSGCIACEFKSLFWESAAERISLSSSLKGKAGSGDFTCIVPSNLLYSVWSHADYMAGYDQQDAHEFLIALLDGLGSHLERYHGEANTSYPRYPSPQYDQNTNTNLSMANISDHSKSVALSSSDNLTEIPVTHPTNLHSLPQVSLLHPSGIVLPPPLQPPELHEDSPTFHNLSSHIQNHSPWSPRITPNKSSCFKGFVNEVWNSPSLHSLLDTSIC